MKKPIKVTVTGAGGQIAYALLFRIASGEMFGHDQPVILEALELPGSEERLKPMRMELDDCAFPLASEIRTGTDAESAFGDADYTILVGARPRSKGMERKDLLTINGESFSKQGRMINDCASKNVRVLVVGNPANTNALIAMHNAPDLKPSQFSCLLRLDHNRAVSMLAQRVGAHVSRVQRMTIWGNHSTTQFPDVTHCLVDGKPATELVDRKWVEDHFIPDVQNRGAKVIEARGASSAASAANAIIGQVHDWASPEGAGKGNWTSMGVYSDGNPYGFENDLMFSFPVHCGNGDHSVVKDLSLDDFQRAYIEKSARELLEERDTVAHLLR